MVDDVNEEAQWSQESDISKSIELVDADVLLTFRKVHVAEGLYTQGMKLEPDLVVLTSPFADSSPILSSSLAILSIRFLRIKRLPYPLIPPPSSSD